MAKDMAGCIGTLVSWGVKLLILGVVLVGLYMLFVLTFGGVGLVPDWMMKGYTNQSFRIGEKHMKNKEYELAIPAFEKAIEDKPEAGAMVEDCRFNIAWCCEKMYGRLGILSLENTPEGREAREQRNNYTQKVLEQYEILLKENPKNKRAQTARDLFLMKRG